MFYNILIYIYIYIYMCISKGFAPAAGPLPAAGLLTGLLAAGWLIGVAFGFMVSTFGCTWVACSSIGVGISCLGAAFGCIGAAFCCKGAAFGCIGVAFGCTGHVFGWISPILQYMLHLAGLAVQPGFQETAQVVVIRVLWRPQSCILQTAVGGCRLHPTAQRLHIEFRMPGYRDT